MRARLAGRHNADGVDLRRNLAPLLDAPGLGRSFLRRASGGPLPARAISSPDSFTLRLLLKGAASTFAKAQIALAKVANTYPGWRSRLKIAGCLAAVTVVSFLYFAGSLDLRSVQGLQTALLATP